MGFPIRKSSDQSSFAAPQGLSQRTTSFIASQRQGIHQMLLRHLITLMINVRSAKTGHDRIRKTCSWISPKTCFACQAYPARLAAGQGWCAELGRPLAEYAASLRFQTSALALDQGRRIPLTFRNRRTRSCKRSRRPKIVVEPVGIEPTT